MLFGQAIILGIIQGITEFLPISSSGHLIIVPNLFNWPDQGLGFDAFVHLGTLAAVILFFRNEVKLLITSFFKKSKNKSDWRKLGFYILLATIPAAVFGLLFHNSIATVLRTPGIVATSLIFWAVVMYLAEIYAERFAGKGELPKIGFWPTIAIGFWQVISLIPGTSRSGITMSGGMLAGLNRELAVKFSFLLSIPIVAAAGFYSLFEMFDSSGAAIDWGFVLTGFLASFVSGYIAIALMLKIIKAWGFKPFVIYRIILALIIIFFL